jgi:hypothetical protein
MGQWYEETQGHNRLMLEKELLAREYPGFQWKLDDNGNLCCIGYIGPNDTLRKSYLVVCVFPYNYGYGNRIKVYTPYEDYPSGTPHRYSDNELCLEHSDFHHKMDVLDTLAWTVAWLALFEGFCETGRTW